METQDSALGHTAEEDDPAVALSQNSEQGERKMTLHYGFITKTVVLEETRSSRVSSRSSVGKWAPDNQ